MGNNLLSLFIFVATALPVEQRKIILIQNDLFEISLDSAEFRDQFLAVDYEATTGNIQMVTKDEMHSMLVYQNEEIVFMLPVMSDRVTLGSSLFEQGGTYQLGFKFKDASELSFATMVMN